MEPINCKICNKRFIPHNWLQLTCSKECGKKLTARRQRKYYKPVIKEKGKGKCRLCGNEFAKKTSLHIYCSEECANKIHSIKSNEGKKIRIIREREKGTECLNCGTTFIKTDGKQKYCSASCRHQFNNRKKLEANKSKTKRRKIMVSNGNYDYSISIIGLIEKHGNKCKICGDKVNLKDFEVRSGTFITGEDYPSIDHIHPISKGGTHTWDNIQLAHRRCNTRKSNAITYSTKSGQIKLSI